MVSTKGVTTVAVPGASITLATSAPTPAAGSGSAPLVAEKEVSPYLISLATSLSLRAAYGANFTAALPATGTSAPSSTIPIAFPMSSRLLPCCTNLLMRSFCSKFLEITFWDESF